MLPMRKVKSWLLFSRQNLKFAETTWIKRHWTLFWMVIVKDQCSHFSVCHHMHKITNLWKFEFNWLSTLAPSCEIIMKEKTPLSHEVVGFQMFGFETSNSKSEVSKSMSWQITSFSKTTPLQREPFLTMFYPTTSPHYSLPSKVSC